VGHIAHKIYKGVLEPYTFPVPREITKYNRMMQINHELYDDKVWDPSKLKIFAGELQGSPITMAWYRADNDPISIYWESEFGDVSDIAVIVVYYEITDSVLYSAELRSVMPAMLLNETRNIKDSLFVALVNNEAAAREMYNAINGANYGPEPPVAMSTLDDMLYGDQKWRLLISSMI
jgi:hypothetical protein